jgi:hypothetical protein
MHGQHSVSGMPGNGMHVCLLLPSTCVVACFTVVLECLPSRCRQLALPARAAFATVNRWLVCSCAFGVFAVTECHRVWCCRCQDLFAGLRAKICRVCEPSLSCFGAVRHLQVTRLHLGFAGVWLPRTSMAFVWHSLLFGWFCHCKCRCELAHLSSFLVHLVLVPFVVHHHGSPLPSRTSCSCTCVAAMLLNTAAYTCLFHASPAPTGTHRLSGEHSTLHALWLSLGEAGWRFVVY